MLAISTSTNFVILKRNSHLFIINTLFKCVKNPQNRLNAVGSVFCGLIMSSKSTVLKPYHSHHRYSIVEALIYVSDLRCSTSESQTEDYFNVQVF
jgi:hypothetical protein